MVSLQCDVHLLSLRPDTAVRDTDFSCYKYHDKTEARTQAERPYALDKTSFAVGRGHKWFLENKRPERLRSSLRELEEMLGELGVIASFGVSQWAEARVKCVLKGGNPPPALPETDILLKGYISGHSSDL